LQQNNFPSHIPFLHFSRFPSSSKQYPAGTSNEGPGTKGQASVSGSWMGACFHFIFGIFGSPTLNYLKARTTIKSKTAGRICREGFLVCRPICATRPFKF
jgi:hypothetical protein